MSQRYAFVPADTGPNSDRSADRTFVKVSAGDTNGQCTLMEDNLKAGFRLGLHLHRHRAETFNSLAGSVDFGLDRDWKAAGTGPCPHFPPGGEEARAISEGCEAARMLMIFQPAGFDPYLADLARVDVAEYEDEAKMPALNDRYDIIDIGPVPERAEG